MLGLWNVHSNLKIWEALTTSHRSLTCQCLPLLEVVIIVIVYWSNLVCTRASYMERCSVSCRPLYLVIVLSWRCYVCCSSSILLWTKCTVSDVWVSTRLEKQLGDLYSCFIRQSHSNVNRSNSWLLEYKVQKYVTIVDLRSFYWNRTCILSNFVYWFYIL